MNPNLVELYDVTTTFKSEVEKATFNYFVWNLETVNFVVCATKCIYYQDTLFSHTQY